MVRACGSYPQSHWFESSHRHQMKITAGIDIPAICLIFFSYSLPVWVRDMTPWPFNRKHLDTLSEALEIAEDKTGDYYKFSSGQWRRHRYDVKTFSRLKKEEMATDAFALLNKCSMVVSGFESKTTSRDFYFICLQDHQILKALRRDTELCLLPLLVYILTHELVHIVRFCNFSQRFDVSGESREVEERFVHGKTYDILKNLSLPKLDYILESYQGYRMCDMATS